MSINKQWQKKPQQARIKPVKGRVPAHDLDAEGAVLAAVLLEKEALDRVQVFLKPEHFYSDANRRVFEACTALSEVNTPVDIQTVASWLRSREWIAQIGGPSYLAQLVDATPSVANVVAHARFVFDKWRIRQVVGTCQRIAAEGYGDVGDVDKWIDAAEQSLFYLAQTQQSSIGPERIAKIFADIFRDIQNNAENGVEFTGIPTGYPELDKRIGGLNEGDLIIVAARPGLGKTSLLLNMLVNVVAPPNDENVPRRNVKYGAVCFSLEMPRKQCVSRIICSESDVNVSKMRSPRMLMPEDWKRLAETGQMVSGGGGWPLWIEDKPSITLIELRAALRRIVAEYNKPATETEPEQKIGVVGIDYLQLMRGREDAQSREQEISEISRGLKELAKEFGVAVIALSQLNRAVETRGKDANTKRPQLSDLRESGSLEQDSDGVIFPYRKSYYDPNCDNAHIAELIVAKNRHGSPGRVYVKWTGQYARFSNLPPEEMPPEGLEE